MAEVNEEENKFAVTLERGLKEFNKLKNAQQISGVAAFDLFQSYGFPLEMTKELATEAGITVDESGFLDEIKKHQDLSRTASAGMFKGGLADASTETKKLHTAAHLMLAALRQVLGEHVVQKGSNITPARLRFDFSHPEKMTNEQIRRVEELVNQAIQNQQPVVCQEMSLQEAKDQGAMGVFESKYGEKVKVYSIGDRTNKISQEICGGPHVDNTKDLGIFTIIKEESSSAGVRRIKAILK
jgi:alanyl-tRNA synthetase